MPRAYSRSERYALDLIRVKGHSYEGGRAPWPQARVLRSTGRKRPLWGSGRFSGNLYCRSAHKNHLNPR